jgi:hypothetical protein
MRKCDGLFAYVWEMRRICGTVSTAVLGGLVFVACVAPMPLVRLTPESPNVTWVSGLAVVTQEQRDVRIAIAFDRHENGTLAFRLEVMNNTTGQLEVSPRDIIFVTCTGPTSYSACSPRQGVIDPEVTLRSLDENRSRESADATNDEILGTSLMLLSVTADVAGMASGKRHSGGGVASTSAMVSSTEAAHQSTLGQIEGEREKWAVTALRRTTLFPDRGMAGYVYMPANFDARFVWVQVQVGERRFPFVFEQVTTRLVDHPSTSPNSSTPRITGQLDRLPSGEKWARTMVESSGKNRAGKQFRVALAPSTLGR